MDSKIEKENLKEMITLLFEIVSGRKNMKLASSILSQEVVIDIDGHRFTGIETWETWIRFLRSRRRFSQVEAISNRMSVDNDRIVVSASWQGVIKGRRVVSNECEAIYKMSGGHISQIQTKRVNYAFFFGNGIKYHVVFIAILCYVWVWKKIFIRSRNS